jgi:hypothetical protein
MDEASAEKLSPIHGFADLLGQDFLLRAEFDIGLDTFLIEKGLEGRPNVFVHHFLRNVRCPRPGDLDFRGRASPASSS